MQGVFLDRLTAGDVIHIQENHPYLEDMTLDQHINDGNLYLVALPDMAMNEQVSKENTHRER